MELVRTTCVGGLPVEEFLEAHATAELGGDCRTRRGSEQHIAGEQRLPCVGPLVTDALQHPRLPGDAGQTTAGEDQGTVEGGHRSAARCVPKKSKTLR